MCVFNDDCPHPKDAAKIQADELKKSTRTNYNKLIQVNNGKIDCNYDGVHIYGKGVYELTELCIEINYGHNIQHCAVAPGQRIELNIK